MEKQLQLKLLSIMSQSELGRRLGKTPQTINAWFRKRVPAEEVIPACYALEWRVTPHELRPDKYLNPTDSIPPEIQATVNQRREVDL
ncbi:helix-turn-helix domain-containing protein [Salmonella enterica]|nr:helix-turn-helix domain-containing protein [Salmonella enterica subsp. enterica serovar Florida]EDY2188877.1 helix-turn-helix domain-containing protein [Salmonella enterica subsp. enterica]EIQ6926320.1 helix-turn-helix domain-containing protein [Salmonella enterica]ECF4168175.1 helix-turn-helix domain-containing protein [Salmonella enterica subsp. enterica serovar Florida]ECW2476804.1 Cro/Cl family transcriptional regulator [Salmonella enterica subsp. enterica serovar Florida]